MILLALRFMAAELHIPPSARRVGAVLLSVPFTATLGGLNAQIGGPERRTEEELTEPAS
jgi:hypothetical protein